MPDAKISIFYSWQNDINPDTHRFLIKKALKSACNKLELNGSSFHVDESTANVPGCPEIVSTILEKITKSAIFVCDITPVCTIGSEERKLIPNPNVMLELGYAAHSLSWNNILCIADTDELVGKMPFDVATRRYIAYSALKYNAEEQLRNKIIQALKAIIEQEAFEHKIKTATTKREQDVAVINSVLREFNFRCFDNYAESIMSARIPTDIFCIGRDFLEKLNHHSLYWKIKNWRINLLNYIKIGKLLFHAVGS